MARRWLQRRGYRTVARHVRIGADEIDLLMWAPGREAIVLVEVKTRVIRQGVSRCDINPLDAMTPAKQCRQIRAAKRLVAESDAMGSSIRFDVVSVRLPERGRPVIEHYVSAFDSS